MQNRPALWRINRESFLAGYPKDRERFAFCRGGSSHGGFGPVFQSYFLRAGLVVILAALVSQAAVALEAAGKVAVAR